MPFVWKERIMAYACDPTKYAGPWAAHPEVLRVDTGFVLVDNVLVQA